MAPTKKMIELATARLGISAQDARTHAEPVPGVEGAYRFVGMGRGAGSIIIDDAGAMLWAASGVTPLQHIEAFRAGRRS